MDSETFNYRDNLLNQMKQGVNTFTINLEDRRETLKAKLVAVERSIAEEEAILRMNCEKLTVTENSIAAEEEKIAQEIQEFSAEQLALKSSLETVQKESNEVKLQARVLGSFLSYLSVNHTDKPGKIICPEGKICLSEDETKSCNYWDCPLINEKVKKSS